MEKISSIIPGNRRIETVDDSQTAPVRKGVPFVSKGNDEAFSTESLPTNAATKTISTEARKAYNELTDSRMKQMEHNEIVRKMTDEFFMNKPAIGPVSIPTTVPTSDEIGQNLHLEA